MSEKLIEGYNEQSPPHIASASEALNYELSRQNAERYTPTLGVYKFERDEVASNQLAQLLYANYLQLRREFVIGMRWFNSREDDTDEYDNIDAQTRYFIKLAQEKAGLDAEVKMTCGMRLTPVDAVEHSLSWSMLNESMKITVQKEQADSLQILQTAAEEGRLWDQTRLVHPLDGSVSSREIIEGMMYLMGAGISETNHTEADESTYWFFTTTTKMKDLLTKLGIQTHVLVSGRIDVHDNDESHFCYVNTPEALTTLQQSTNPVHQRTTKWVESGLENSYAL